MPRLWPSNTDEVDQLLLNARLRDELEPFRDESLDLIDTESMTTPMENEFLAALLAWEHAPVLPISQWFEPELKLPQPSTMRDDELHDLLLDVIQRLYVKRIVLEYTSHLSDRELYKLICRDLLPSREKHVDLPGNFIFWRCCDIQREPDAWLRYYADEQERQQWAAWTGRPLPPIARPPFPRNLPCRQA